MTRRFSCSSPCRSRRRAVALATAFLWSAGVAAETGSVSGSISVWRAALDTEGAKHDRDVVVYLDGPAASAPPSEARVSMDQKGLVFLPHVLAVRKGTTVTFLNSDPDPHNVYFLDDETGDTLDIGTWGPGVSVDHRFEKAGVSITLCKLHLEMAAFIVVLDGPYFTKVELDASSPTGRYTIADVPPGEYSLTVWHKKLKQKGGPRRITVTAGEVSVVDVVLTKAKYAGSSE